MADVYFLQNRPEKRASLVEAMQIRLGDYDLAEAMEVRELMLDEKYEKALARAKENEEAP